MLRKLFVLGLPASAGYFAGDWALSRYKMRPRLRMRQQGEHVRLSGSLVVTASQEPPDSFRIETRDLCKEDGEPPAAISVALVRPSLDGRGCRMQAPEVWAAGDAVHVGVESEVHRWTMADGQVRVVPVPTAMRVGATLLGVTTVDRNSMWHGTTSEGSLIVSGTAATAVFDNVTCVVESPAVAPRGHVAHLPVVTPRGHTVVREMDPYSCDVVRSTDIGPGTVTAIAATDATLAVVVGREIIIRDRWSGCRLAALVAPTRTVSGVSIGPGRHGRDTLYFLGRDEDDADDGDQIFECELRTSLLFRAVAKVWQVFARPAD